MAKEIFLPEFLLLDGKYSWGKTNMQDHYCYNMKYEANLGLEKRQIVSTDKDLKFRGQRWSIFTKEIQFNNNEKQDGCILRPSVIVYSSSIQSNKCLYLPVLWVLWLSRLSLILWHILVLLSNLNLHRSWPKTWDLTGM